MLAIDSVHYEIPCVRIRADGYVIWFLMICSDPMLKKQPHSERLVEASVPLSDEVKNKGDEPADE